MLSIINEDLFAFSVWSGNNQSGNPIFRLNICSGNKIVRLADMRNQDTKRSHAGDSMAATVPINREILKLSAPDEHYSDRPMSMKVYDNEKGIPTVELRALDYNRENRANLYLIAFPFNGLLKPIPESPLYRIYKGALVTSQKYFYFNNAKYKKVLYLVVEPNLNLFNPDHKYHQDKIEIRMESYSTFKNREKNYEENSAHNTMVVTIKDHEGNYDLEWFHEMLPEAVTSVSEPNTPLWVTFRFTPKEGASTNTDGHQTTVINMARPKDAIYDKPAGKKGQPKSYIQGNVRITTNRNGIRKEIPLHRQDRPKNLDQMMRDAGVFDERDDGRYGGKGKKGSKKRR